MGSIFPFNETLYVLIHVGTRSSHSGGYEEFCLLRYNAVQSIAAFFALLVLGRALAQAVIRWLPTAAARVRVRAACGVCGGQSGTEAGFLRVLRFSLPTSFHQFLHHHNHPRLAQ
jgi:hypothetical protein